MRVLVVVLALTAVIRPLALHAQPSPPPAPPAGTVMLPLADYERLLDSAETGGTAGIGASLAVSAAAAVLTVRVDADGAGGTLVLRGTAMTAPALVPLVAHTAIVDVRLNGAPAALVAGAGQVTVLVTATGPFEIAADWRTDVRTAGGRAAITLPGVRALALRAALTLPGEAADLRLTGGVVTARRPAGAASDIEATLQSGTAAEVSWRVRDLAPAAVAGPPRVEADVSSLVTLDETDIRLACLVTLAVSRGALSSATLTLPAGFRLAGLHGPTIDRITPEAGQVTITFTTPEAPQHRMLALLERGLPGTAFELDMPTVAVREAGRERGALAVEAPGAIALTPRAGVGLRPADVRDLPVTVQALARWPVLAAYRYQRNAGEPEPRLALGASRFPFADGAAATAGRAFATTFLTVDGRALTEMRVRVANQRQAFAKVALPAGGQIVSAALDEVAVRPVSSADGLRLPLRGNGTGPVRELTFVYLHDGGPFDRRGERQLALPRLDLPIGVVHWELFVPDALEVRRVGGSALEARPFASADPVPWGGATRRVDAPARPRVRLSAEPGGHRGASRAAGGLHDGQRAVSVRRPAAARRDRTRSGHADGDHHGLGRRARGRGPRSARAGPGRRRRAPAAGGRHSAGAGGRPPPGPGARVRGAARRRRGPDAHAAISAPLTPAGRRLPRGPARVSSPSWAAGFTPAARGGPRAGGRRRRWRPCRPDAGRPARRRARAPAP
ncbi:MAG: hypothetical protein R2708_18760 [Vicinamibacterales bacterium]